ncbi:MAG TPA: hypothetical protein VMF32_01730, partial [Xanthobacteraceae bacterium]|nr:hypothetical protein [Xanthobacteraceae bacterium]
PQQPPGSYPVSVNGQVGTHFVGAYAGNGVAGGDAGTNNGGQEKGVSAGTQAPGEACTTLPGTDIPYDCPQ